MKGFRIREVEAWAHQHLRPGTVVRSDGLACFRGVKPAGCEHELIQTIMACKTGLDVYVEKPLALTVAEGRKMLDTARHYRTVVQTGSQQRSGPHYAEAIKLVQEGAIGAVHHVEAGFERNSLPGWGNPVGAKPPGDLNYEMWLGPAPRHEYNPLRSHYHFRWFWDQSGGQMTNWGAHNIDIARWGLASEFPVSVSAYGGRYATKDKGNPRIFRKSLTSLKTECSHGL